MGKFTAKTRTAVALGIVVALSTGCPERSGRDARTIKCVPADLPQAMMVSAAASVEVDPTEWPAEGIQCEIAGYTFHVFPTADEPAQSAVIVFRDGSPIFSRISQDLELWDGWRPIVGIDDRSGDGVFDVLTYDVYRDTAPVSTVVMDKGFDGQADIRVVKQRQGEPATWWLWVENGWYERMPGRDLAVLVDGKPRRYEVEGDRAMFAE